MAPNSSVFVQNLKIVIVGQGARRNFAVFFPIPCDLRRVTGIRRETSTREREIDHGNVEGNDR
jgi:hypothetical protein